MFRLLGFLVGSVAAITIILIVLGLPDFHFDERTNDQQRFDAAVKMLKEKQQEIASAAEEKVTQVAASVTEDTDVPQPAPVAATPVTDDSENAAAELPVDELPLPVSEAEATLPTVVEELQWYSFWNPFRSEIAARGFVSQLEKVTGLDYRIVKVKTGVYEVAFAYGDDGERRTKLSQISSATGLDLPDS
ncbi:MAG: hypothetical protein R3192_06475 [Woeseiaceae bacterium]|nr:hypothetical protein [Woeseiaceae bacterium]